MKLLPDAENIMNHINAREVFSERIIREIQRYYSGGYFWIPNQDYKERNEKIYGLRKNGKSIRDIAEKMNLTQRRIKKHASPTINLQK
jgi:DNA-binding NarL/FixJ family response regulator